jgi:tRNA(Ile)-lysidine synthase
MRAAPSRSAPPLRESGLAAVERPLPLALAELEAALAAVGGFEPRPLIAVATSGGPDSLALAILADRWASRKGGVAWALIVDHGLRPESACEAKMVADWLAARQIPHVVLTWHGGKPATGIQAAARAARYRLLAEWCGERGCLHLLLAHHRDDQAETYLIRRRAGSGPYGLAAMSAVRELPQLRLVRPLLGVAKARLVALLDAEGQEYLRDPSNRNPAFERSRLRMQTAGAIIESSAREARAMGLARLVGERDLAALLARAVALHPGGFALLDPGPVAAAGELGERALGRVAAVIGGGDYPLRGKRLARLRETFDDRQPRARTLGGCRFVPWRGRVFALRETVRSMPPLSLAPGASALWDRRFAATLPASAREPVTVGQLGTAGVAELPRDTVAGDNPLPRLIYPALPAVWDEAGLAAVPALSWRRATAACVAELAFRPAVSLFGTGFTVV